VQIRDRAHELADSHNLKERCSNQVNGEGYQKAEESMLDSGKNGELQERRSIQTNSKDDSRGDDRIFAAREERTMLYSYRCPKLRGLRHITDGENTSTRACTKKPAKYRMSKSPKQRKHEPTP
jgi:hypothetical protein